MPRTNVEAGLKNFRAGYVAETTTGTPPTDPAFARYGDVLLGIDWSPGLDVFPLRGLGNVDPLSFNLGPETHGLTLRYYLEEDIASNALNDVLTRDADNLLPNSHTVWIREARTVDGGTEDAGQRVHTVGVGCYAGTGRLAGSAGTGEPIVAEIGYMSEKIRSYAFDENAASGTVTLESTVAGDTSINIDLEDDDAGTSETVALNGSDATTPVTSVQSYTELDSIRPQSTMSGDLIVKKGANEVARIRGTTSTGTTEADEGTPLLGSGSHGAAIGGTFETFQSATIQRGGSDLAFSVVDWEVRVDNGLELVPQASSRRQRVMPGFRTIECVTTTFGPKESHLRIEEALIGTQSNIVIVLSGCTVTLTSCQLTTPPNRAYEVGQGVMQVGATFTAEGITIT